MKCITDGNVIKRVSDAVALDYIKEGWKYTSKKEKAPDGTYFCKECGNIFHSDKKGKCPKCKSGHVVEKHFMKKW